MKVYAINLERSVERRKHIVRHLEKLKLDYELVKAVDGAALDAEELKNLCDLEAVAARPHKLTGGAIGCALSHLAVYRKMIADGADSALVIEDDAILPKNIHYLLRQIKINLAPAEIVMLHYNGVGGETPILSQFNAKRLDDCGLYYPVKFPMSTAGYVIGIEAARTLANMILPVRIEADDWEYFYRNGWINSLRCVYPKPFETTQADTEVQICHFDEIHFKHRVWRTISDYKIPLLYPLACLYLRRKEKKTPIELVDTAPIVTKPAAMPQTAFQNKGKLNV